MMRPRGRAGVLMAAGLLFVLAAWLGQAAWRLGREAMVRAIPVQAAAVERKVPVEAWILRREWVLHAPASGYLVPLARAGQHVPKNAVVAEVVDRVERASLGQELEELERELARVAEALQAQKQAEAAFRRDREQQEAALEGQIAFAAAFDRTSELESLLQLRDRFREEAARHEAALAAQRAELEADRERLESRRQSVLQRLQSATDLIRAPEAGRFDLQLDGLEEWLQPGRAGELSPRVVKGLEARPRHFSAGDRVVAGQPVARLVDPHQVWVYLFLPSGHGLQPGRQVLFQFGEAQPVAARVREVTFFGEENGVLIELQAIPEEVLEARRVRGVLILDRWEGVVVPESALVVRNGVTGMLVEATGGRLFTRVQVKGSDGKWAAVSGLRPGSRVVVNPRLLGEEPAGRQEKGEAGRNP